MSDLIPCPTCGATLRLPPSAAMVRCPRCKTVIPVGPEAATVPPRPAFPLGRRPAAPAPEPDPAPPPPRATVRGREVPEDEPDPQLLEEERAKDRQKRLATRAALEKKLAPLEPVCRAARTGVTMLALGAAASCLASVIFFFYDTTTLFAAGGFPPLLALAGAVLAIHWLLTVAGFGFCIGGPEGVRAMAVAGLLLTILHLGVYVPLALTLSAMVSLEEIGVGGSGPRGGVNHSLLLSNIFNNLTTVTDLPLYLLGEGLVRPAVLILPVVGGALEFAKLSLMGILTNHYAVEGKDPELGHLALRFVYRIFWLVIAGVVLKLGLWMLVKLTGGEPLLMAWFVIPIFMLTNAYFLWWAFAWFAQYRTMMDIVEVVTPERFADTRQRLTEV